MTRRLTNKGVAAAWAAGLGVETVESGNGNFWATGRTIYSYGLHFPVARTYEGGRRYRGRYVLLTCKEYSDERATGQTTKQHVSLAHMAAHKEGLRVFCVPFIRAESSEEQTANLLYLLSEAAKAVATASRRRNADYAASDIARASSLIRQAIMYKAATGVEGYCTVAELFKEQHPTEARTLREWEGKAA